MLKVNIKIHSSCMLDSNVSSLQIKLFYYQVNSYMADDYEFLFSMTIILLIYIYWTFEFVYQNLMLIFIKFLDFNENKSSSQQSVFNSLFFYFFDKV